MRPEAKPAQDVFPQTEWTKLNAEYVAEWYWKPVYCYLRRKGFNHERAENLTQGFFSDRVLEARLIETADRAKGRFRNLLLTALVNYAIDTRRIENAQKRHPNSHAVSVQDLGAPLAGRDDSPEDIFNRVWASSLLENVIEQLERDCRRDDLEVHWLVFRKMVLLPCLEGADSPALPQLCDDLQIASPAKASNMIVTVKRRFGNVLRSYVRQFVVSDDQVDDEIRDLMTIVSK